MDPQTITGVNFLAGIRHEDQYWGAYISFLHRLVNSCSRFLVRVILRPVPCLFCTREAFLANFGNLAATPEENLAAGNFLGRAKSSPKSKGRSVPLRLPIMEPKVCCPQFRMAGVQICARTAVVQCGL